MPRFRIQSNLHLDGFQMLDACLENVTSFEGLDDKNDGRIVFLNGSSGNQSNLHPAVCYGRVFKGLAYLDDIDKITNGEGSLGTRVKALEDMLNVDSAETVVSTWEEIQAFLDNVKEGTDLMTMLDDKLSKSEGGTISKNLSVNGYIYAHSRIVEYGLMEFRYQDNQYAFLANNAHAGREGKNLAIYNGTSWYDLIHTGNVGEYTAGAANHLNSTEVSGEGSDSILDDIFTKKSGISVNIARNLGSGSLFVSRDTIVVNYSWGGRYGQQWAIEDTSHKILVRTKNADQTGAEWSDWKTIAFTDSTVEAANRLANKVSLWGNEFDGTQSLDKAIQLNNAHSIWWLAADKTTRIEALVLNNGNNFLIGQGVAKAALDTFIYGKNIKFCYGTVGTSAQTAMTITEEGRVLINSPSTILNRKLSIGNGGVFVGATLAESPVLGSVGSNSLLVGASTYGMQHWTLGDGRGNIQAGRFDGTATAYALNLNPFGGAVNVGEGGLNVAGGIKSGDKFNLTTSSMNLGSATTPLYLFLAKPDANYIWASANGGYINLGVYDSGTTNSANATLSIYSDRVVSGQRNNAVSLGTSSYRWSNVYSVLGNFSGLATFNGGALIPTGQKLTIGDANGDHATIEYDSIAKAIKVDGNLFTTGTNASGGKADDQSGNTSGGSAEVYKYDLGRGEQVYEIQNVKGDVNVNIQVYEWNGNSNSWDMILTDVSVNETNITVTFGRPTSVDHMVTVV